MSEDSAASAQTERWPCNATPTKKRGNMRYGIFLAYGKSMLHTLTVQLRQHQLCPAFALARPGSSMQAYHAVAIQQNIHGDGMMCTCGCKP